MAITSVGYDGQINETEWALMAPRLNLPYWVAEMDALAPTINTKRDRAVDLAPGQFGGPGVMDTSSAVETMQFDSVESGDRYDMIVARRNWQGTGGKTTLEVIKGGTVRQLPPFNRNPGVLDDQLIALVHLRAGQTRPVSVTDLRGLGTSGRAIVFDPLAMEGYRNWPGFQCQIGREEYTLQPNRTWVRTGLISATTPAYRLRLLKTKTQKYGGGLQNIGAGWKTSGDNTMGVQVLSDGRIKITKAGIYSFSVNVYNYDGKKKPAGTYKFRMDGLWVKPTFESHRNAGTNGWEESLDWTGTLTEGNVIQFQFAHYLADRKSTSMTFEIQIEMVA